MLIAIWAAIAVLATGPRIPVAAAGAVMLAGVKRGVIAKLEGPATAEVTVVGVPSPYVADPMRLWYIWEAEEALYGAKAMGCG